MTPIGIAPLLWLSGPPCVGKSTVGWELFQQIRQGGTKAAYVDLEQISFCRPAVDAGRLRARNLRAVCANYRNAGAQSFVVVGAVPDEAAFGCYVDNLADVWPRHYRLRASPETLTAREFDRGRGIGPALPGDEMRRCRPAELHEKAREAVHAAAELDRLQLGFCIATDDRSPAEIAAVILHHTGL